MKEENSLEKRRKRKKKGGWRIKKYLKNEWLKIVKIKKNNIRSKKWKIQNKKKKTYNEGRNIGKNKAEKEDKKNI